MSLGPSLIVPVVLWGRHPPTHRISCVYLTPDQRTLVTGCADGQIVTWDVHPSTLEVNPYMMLVGHTARIVCLSNGLLHTNHRYLVSAALNGEMCVWDLHEGQCMETVKMSFIHRQIEAYQPTHAPDVLLFCCGEYADIAVVHPLTLEVVYWLSSKVNSNWVTSLHIFKPKAVADDIVMAINADSVVKIWTLSRMEGKCSSDIVYENESKRIRSSGVNFLKCCSYNPRTVLVVSSSMWQIYDASDFSVLCSSSGDEGERWQRGEFLTADRVIVWADSGHAFIYRLPPNCIPTHEAFHSREADEPFLYCVLSSPGEQELFSPPVSIHTELHGEANIQLLVRGDCLGQLAIWRVPRVTNNQLAQLLQQQLYRPPEMPPTVLWSIERAWQSMKPPPVGVLDQLESADGSAPLLTSSIYLPLQEGRLVCGREDGTIIIVSATHTVMLHLLHGKHQSYDNWPIHQILSGHRGRVTALLFPHLSHSRYQISQLVSGGEDFSVCLWDLFSGALLHRFVVQAGIISQLHVPPETVSPRMQQCICSVADDYSVALLSLKERKCLMLASRHLFPIATVKWRPLDDFLVVSTEDGSVSVWQMETGHLDRVVHGTTAQEVLSACDENMTVSISEGGMANPAVHFFRGLRHRNLSAIRHAAKRGLQQLQNNADSLPGQHESGKPRSYALMVQGLRTNAADPDRHVLFFDVESLIVDLLTEAYSQMSTEALEEHGLIQLTEYQRVLELTRSESPDAQQKISEFFGRVKHKAGDVEKRLKEKDTRGYLSRMKELKEQSEAIRDHLKERAEGSGLLARVKEGAETMGGIIQAKAGGAGLKGTGENRKVH
ncbi:WD repeat-containing protein 7-like [Pollicipes pollicipes]|uniref:WD repeat-containing protein 7-like n=1 Tax=Pollicipes pollicipes TaxID=41117 RepID=UPI00188513D3|nr:WD repeat-containing protein 7-like [Pollicipes pollicipes]